MGDLWRNLSRNALIGLLFFRPSAKRIALDRRLRGREEHRKLQLADWVLMSWGKSGRTWLRVMLSHFYHLRFGVPERELLGFDNLHRKNPAVPRVFFTHNNYLPDFTGHHDSKVDYEGKKIVLLVRDPRDVAVSQFFQWKYRMHPWKKRLNGYPPHGSDISLFDFMLEPAVGLPRIIGYFNEWLEALPELGSVLVVRYEDMRKEPARVLGEILSFTNTPGSADQIREAVEFAAYDNMKKLEQKKFFRLSGSRVVPGSRKNPDSFKVRRAKVGGYRDYFEDAQLAQIDTMVDERLHPSLGYTRAQPPEPTAGNAVEPEARS